MVVWALFIDHNTSLLASAAEAQNSKTMKMIKKTDNYLSAVQIAGCDPVVMAEASKICEDNGADIIDIGGESSRPGAKPVSAAEEIKRISPLLIELAKNTDSTISIDTYKSSTAIYALDNGAHLINDISGMTHDKKMVNIISRYKVPIVIMHMKGTPKTMQQNPTYDNIINEISDFLVKQANIAINAGVSNEKIIIDPGIGFGTVSYTHLTLPTNREV